MVEFPQGILKMLILRTIKDYKAWRENVIPSKRIGFVPTMGALHIGHAALLKESKKENDLSVLSIFVNPTQFNQKEDFEKYPKTENEDLEIAKECQVDVVFIPQNPKELYPDDYRYVLKENIDSLLLCGAHRPGHFDGVLSVVLKLLQIIQPKTAYFGEKDYQQFKLIKEMAEAYFLPFEIKSLPTIRLESGLAFSSRNRRLSAEGIIKASELYKALKSKENVTELQKQLSEKGFEVEYFEERWGRRFIAAWLEGVRLIDNIAL